jgi:hypothetical protein
MLYKAEGEATLERPRRCTVKAFIGVVYFHDLFHCLKGGGHMLSEDIHLFWWYDRAKVSTTIENQALQGVVLNSVVVEGNGRSKGPN